MKIINYILVLTVAFSLPALVIYSGLNYELNRMMFSSHGGSGMLAGLFCFPWVVFVFTMYVIKKKDIERRNHLYLSIASIVAYSIMTIPLSSRVAVIMNFNWGVSNDWKIFWGLINFPLSLILQIFYE